MRRGKSCLLFVFLSFALESNLIALDPNKPITQYVHNFWKIEQGLPQNRVNDIIQTRDGYLWLTSHESLIRFDGVRFTVFEQRNIPELSARNLPIIVEDQNGNLWIATEGAGVARYKNGKFSSLTTKNGLSDNSVLSLAVDPDGSLWIGTQWGGLNHFQNGKVTVYKAQDGTPGNRINILYIDEGGTLWIGGEGLSRFRNGTFQTYTTADGLSHRIVSSITSDKKGAIWLGTWGGGVDRFQDGKFTVFTTKEGLSHNEIRDIHCDRNGNVWVGTREGGLNRFRNGKWEVYSKEQGLSDTGVRAIYEDRFGSIWVGTYNGGLNRFKDGNFITYSAEEGLTNDDLWAIYGDHHKNLWAGTTHGLVRFSNGIFTSFGEESGLTATNIVSIYGDSSDSIWVGTRGGGLFVFRDGRFTQIPLYGGKLLFVNCLYVDHSDNVWVGTPEGLIRIQNGVQSFYTTRNGLIHNNISFVIQDHSQNLWIGTRGGLALMKGNQFKSYPTKKGVSALFEDSEGILWVGTIRGLHRWQSGTFKTYTTRDGLFDDTPGAIAEDSAGNLWISGGHGIFRINKKDILNFDRGLVPSLTFVAYGSADGLKDIECSSGPPGVWKDETGKLWFSTVKGMTVIDPRTIQVKSEPPFAIIEEFYADKKFYDPADKTFTVPPGRNRLEFRYTGMNLLSPERVNFQYKLDGYDQQWVDAGTQRFISYTNISPGNYAFRVRARNNDSPLNGQEAVLQLNLRPYFYQTRYFSLLCLMGVFVSIFGLYRLRIRSLKKREAELVKTVDLRTSQLQDSNRRLEDAHARITKLLETRPQEAESIPAWSKSMAHDIASGIGATRIGIWILEGEVMTPLGNPVTRAPSLDETKQAMAGIIRHNSETVVPVLGATGVILGALMVIGENIVWSEIEIRLITSLAHQLASALEMQQMRKDLVRAQEKKISLLQELQNRGILTMKICPHCLRCYDHAATECDSDGRTLQVEQILPFRIMDRYRLVRMLGQGATGSVYQAQDEKLNRFVAIKILRREFLDDPFMKIRWEREARIVANLRHQGIVNLYDLGELPDASAVCVMEFLNGVDVARMLKNQGVPNTSQLAAVLDQVGDALQSAHREGVIHRDLKPANLFFVPRDKGFQIKIVDFGLAKSIRGDATLTRTGILMGTPSYMSPEQVKGQHLDQRSDLFSLASVTYEMLTGKAAFSADSVPEVFLKIISENPAPLSGFFSDVDPELQEVISWAHQKDPDKRPKEVAEWIVKLIPIIKRLDSSFTGWNSIPLLAQLSIPLNPGMTTAEF